LKLILVISNKVDLR